jgi:DNA-binding winged helix-turn-helix (wHTH) protein
MSFAGVQDVSFGPFRLSVRRRILSRRGAPVALTGRAFDLLTALVDSSAPVVTKDELMRRVWGAIVVEENNLHVQIAAIRRALGAGERYIVTIHGRGYRFVGDLRPASDEAKLAGSPDLSRSWAPAAGREPTRRGAPLGPALEQAEFGDLIVGSGKRQSPERASRAPADDRRRPPRP